MQITFYSILMAVFWSGILTGMLYIMRKRCSAIKRFGIVCIVLLYLFCMARMLLPIDFSFSKGMHLRGIYADICDILCFKKLPVGGYLITVQDILAIIWFLGSFVQTIRFIREYRSVYGLLNQMTAREDEQCIRVLQNIYEEKGRKFDISVFKNEEIPVPMGLGVFNRNILLPDREYTDEELYFVLLHEYTHFVNGDLSLKLLAHVFCCIFWWNPVIYYLQKELDKSLEVKCDLCITEDLSMGEMLEYMQTVVATLQSPNRKKKFPLINDAVSLSGSMDEMIERFSYIQKSRRSSGESRRAIAAWLLTMVIVFMASYSFVPLPSYEAPIEEIETDPNAHAVMPENSYIVYKNGKYYLISGTDSEIEVDLETAREMKAYDFKIKEE